MPKVLLLKGYSFFFYSNEGNEPEHIHVSKADSDAKFWLVPVIELEYSDGFGVSDLRNIRAIIDGNRDLLLEKWNEHFS